MTSYPITGNCNFESRDDACGKAIHEARQAVESGLTEDAQLVEAMDSLEETLREHAESGSVLSVEACQAAEETVTVAWTAELQEAVETARQARHVD